MADRNIRFIPKRTAVPGRIPTGTTGTESNFIKQGELALNTADHKLFSYDGANVFEIGSTFTGGTISGNFAAPNITATTAFYSGSTELGSLIASSFARISHTHPISEITGLQTQLNNKSDLSGATFTGNVKAPVFTATTYYSGSTLLDSLFARTVHTHSITDVTGLQTQLNNKADLSGATFSGGIFGSSVSATTLYSGQTDIQNVFQEIAHDYVKNKITVGKTGATFSSIGAALASITDNSMSNRYLIEVGPGFYVEDTLVLKEFVDIEGVSYNSVVIEVDSPNKDVIILVPNTTVTNLRLQGSTSTGQTIFNIVSDFSPLQSSTINNCTIGDTDIILKSSLDIGNFALVGFYGLSIAYGTSFNHGLDISGSGSTVVSISETKMSIVGSSQDFINLRGLNNRVIVAHSALLVQTMIGASLGYFAKVYDGSTLDILSVGVDGATIGFFNENNGSGAYMRINDYSSINSTYDIIINHPDTIGNLRGAITKDKVIINPDNNTFALNYIEPLGGSVITGNLFFGDSNEELTKINKLVFETPTIGLLSGGEITLVSGQTISVASGNGYLLNDSTNFYQFIEWSAGTVSASTNSVKYVTVDEHGVINLANSLPNNINKIILGKIITDGTKIVSINNTPFNAAHYNNSLDNKFREAIGAIYVSGSLVSQNVTPFKIDVGSGAYYSSTKKFNPSGGTAINLTTVYRSATPGQHIYVTADTVSNTQYDNNSGTLASIPSGKYVKHTLYCNGEGADEKYFLVYGQEYFNSSNEANAGNLPSPPIGFDESIVRISSLVVSQSGTSITSIIDQRPLNASSAAAATSVTAHGNLTGLLNDDHPQYFRTDGGRILTGTFNLGGNDIISAGTFNGISINSHASRHLPNGTDPLATAGPVTVGMSNNTGTANSFSRSDHRHAHGEQTGGTSHSAATQSVAGFMSAVDKTFLDSVPSILNTKVDLSGDTFTGGVFAPSISATTLYSGSTLLETTINTIIYNSTIHGNFLSLSGGTVTGETVYDITTIVEDYSTAHTLTTINGNGMTMTTNAEFSDSSIYSSQHQFTSDSAFSNVVSESNNVNISSGIFASQSGYTLSIGDYSSNFLAGYSMDINGLALATTKNGLGDPNFGFIKGDLLTGNTIYQLPIKGGKFALTSDLTGFTIGNFLSISGGTVTGNTRFSSNLSATTYYSGSTLVDSLFARTVHTHVISDVTGLQTQLTGKADLTGSTFAGGVSAPNVSATTITGTTYYSGGTLIDSLFARTVHTHVIADVTGLQTQLNNKADLTGSTFSGGVFAPSVSATTLYSGSTLLESIIRSLITGSTLQGNYLSLGGGTVTGNTSFSTNLSATTFYSGSTLLDSLFARTVHSHVISDVNGLQANLNNKADLTGATFSGGVFTPSVSATTITATTLYSGATLVDSLFARTIHGHVISDVSGLQTQLNNKADLTGATFTGNVRVPVFTATTFYSGATLVDSLFARTVHGHVISDVTGLQTQLNNKADLTGSTFTGGVSAPSVSGATLYSGGTLVDSLFARTVHGHVISDVTGLQTQLTNKADLTGATFTGGVSAPSVSGATLYSGNTNLYSIFAPFGSGGSVFTGGTSFIFTGITNVNFGNSNELESYFAVTSVTNSNITNNSVISFTILNSVDHPSVEESLMEGITLKESNIIEGLGFTLNAYSPNGTWGNYDVYYKIINISSPDSLLVFTGGTVTGATLFTTNLSATTLYSGSTLIDSLFARTVHSHVISDVTGLQTQLNNKADLTGATFTGNVRVPVFTATTLYSGATLVDSLFARTVHTHVISDVTGLQTQLNGKADLTGATFVGGVSAPNVSGVTLYSGSTLIDSLFARTVHNHVISDVTGLQTQLNGKADLTGSTFTGGIFTPNISATTLYSGATLVDSLFARTIHNHVISDVTGLQTHLNNKVNLSGSTLTGDFFNTSSGFFQFATGTTVQRPAVSIIGMMRYNTTLNKFEVYESTGWREVGTHWSSTGSSISYTGGNTLIGSLVDIPTYKLQVTGNTLISGNIVVTGESNVLIVSSGSTAQRPAGITGAIRYNSTNGVFEGYERNAWVELGNIQYVQFSLLGQINNSTASFWYAKDETGVTGAYRSVDTGNGISSNNIDPWLAPYNGRIVGAVVFCKGLGAANGSPAGPFTYRATVYNVGNGGSQTTGMTTMDFIFPTGTTVGAYNSSVSTYASTEYIATSAVTFNRGQNIGMVWNPVGTGLPGAITVQEGTRLTLIVQKTL